MFLDDISDNHGHKLVNLFAKHFSSFYIKSVVFTLKSYSNSS